MTHHTRQKWLSVIRLFRQSSLTMRAFAEAQNLNPSTFRNYYYRLRHLVDDQNQDRPHFLPISLVDAESVGPDGSRVKLVMSTGLSLQFDSLPAPGYLAELVALLQES